jgi:hypothetical protein
VNPTPPILFLKRHSLTLAAVLVGVFLGRTLKQGEQQDAAAAGGPVRAADTNGFGPAAEASSPAKVGEKDSDAAVEAEVARILGGAAPDSANRTPQQTMDAISSAVQEKSDLRRFLAVYEAVSELGKDDVGAALERARKEDNAIAIRALERRWGEIDPVGAAKAWASGESKPLGDAFFSAWSKTNPSSALRWYAGLEDGDIKNQARSLILDRVAKTDPQRALDFANQLPDGKDQTQLISRALANLGAKDPAEALAAARRLPEGAGRKAGIDSVVNQVASTNLKEAQRLIEELPPNTVTNASAAVAAALARKGPETALEWAGTLPDGQSKEAAFGGIAREWAGRDVQAAAGWLDTLPAGAAKNAAVASFATRAAPRDPEGATVWAATLPQGSQRSSVLAQTVGIWQRLNPEAAADWIKSAPGLSADERTALTHLQTQRPDLGKFQSARRERSGN